MPPLAGVALVLLVTAACDPPRPPTENAPQAAASDANARGNDPAAHAGPVEFGAVVGQVVYRGRLPGATTMHVAEAGELEAHTIITDPSTRGLKNAVVWIEGVRPAPSARDREAVILDQNDWTFVPHVLAVRAGQRVQFRNSEPVNHTARSFTPGHEFNYGTPAGVGVSHRFRRPTGGAPARVECDVHEWMLAWIYVFEHDAFAVTDVQGRFRIDGVEAGSYRVRVHHADGNLAASSELRVIPDSAASLTIEVGRGRGVKKPR